MLALAASACAAHTGSPAPAAPTASAAAPAPERELARVTVDDVAARIARHESVFIYDNNQRARYEQGHVPGAVWVPAEQVSAENLPADHAAQLTFYCAGERCTACHQAARRALSLGYTNVTIMPGGIAGWTASGHAVVAGPNPS